MMLKNSEKRKRIAHIIAGTVILISSYEKYQAEQNSYLLFGLAGLIFIVIGLFHSAFERKFPWLDGASFFIEGILSLIIAVDFFVAGKNALPWVYLLIGFFQLFMAFKKSKKAAIGVR
jgi:uncharacterized membrane protein HdeD (DUF308 family)